MEIVIIVALAIGVIGAEDVDGKNAPFKILFG